MHAEGVITEGGRWGTCELHSRKTTHLPIAPDQGLRLQIEEACPLHPRFGRVPPCRTRTTPSCGSSRSRDRACRSGPSPWPPTYLCRGWGRRRWDGLGGCRGSRQESLFGPDLLPRALVNDPAVLKLDSEAFGRPFCAGEVIPPIGGVQRVGCIWGGAAGSPILSPKQVLGALQQKRLSDKSVGAVFAGWSSVPDPK